MLVERAGQPLERPRGHLARYAGAHHAAAEQLSQRRRVALGLARAGAEGETVPEGEPPRLARQPVELRPLAACREGKGEREQKKTAGWHGLQVAMKKRAHVTLRAPLEEVTDEGQGSKRFLGRADVYGMRAVLSPFGRH